MKYKYFIGLFIIISVLTMWYLDSTNKSKVEVSTIKPISSSALYINLQKGNVVKQVTDYRDISKIIEFINSVEFEKDPYAKADENWDYLIRIFNNDKKHQNITFNENIVQYVDGSYYIIDQNAYKNLVKIYKNLEYKEVHWSEIYN
jgi:hypothetical protein